MSALHAGRQFASGSASISARTRLIDVDRVRVRQDEDAHEHRALPGEAHLGVVVLRAQHHVRDVPQPNERAVLLRG